MFGRQNTGTPIDRSHMSQGDLRFVMTVKGSRILLGVATAAEELKPVVEQAQDFSLLSFKVT